MNAIPSSISKSLSLATKENKNAVITVGFLVVVFFSFLINANSTWLNPLFWLAGTAHVSPHYEPQHPPKVIPPRRQRDRPKAALFRPGPGALAFGRDFSLPRNKLCRHGSGAGGDAGVRRVVQVYRGAGTRDTADAAWCGGERRSAGLCCPDYFVQGAICPQKYPCDSQKRRPGLPASTQRGTPPPGSPVGTGSVPG